jgi:ribosomal protein S18 acetylase RimI-like enzyme
MIQFTPMSQEQFPDFRHRCIEELASECIKSGYWKDLTISEALKKAAIKQDDGLPNGVNTPDNYFFNINETESSTQVGAVWFAKRNRDDVYVAYIFEIHIKEPFQNKGYGLSALLKLEEKVRQLGLDTIQLHVFEYNVLARALYKKAGYYQIKNDETSLILEKKL